MPLRARPFSSGWTDSMDLPSQSLTQPIPSPHCLWSHQQGFCSILYFKVFNTFLLEKENLTSATVFARDREWIGYILLEVCILCTHGFIVYFLKRHSRNTPFSLLSSFNSSQGQFHNHTASAAWSCGGPLGFPDGYSIMFMPTFQKEPLSCLQSFIITKKDTWRIHFYSENSPARWEV